MTEKSSYDNLARLVLDMNKTNYPETYDEERTRKAFADYLVDEDCCGVPPADLAALDAWAGALSPEDWAVCVEGMGTTSLGGAPDAAEQFFGEIEEYVLW